MANDLMTQLAEAFRVSTEPPPETISDELAAFVNFARNWLAQRQPSGLKRYGARAELLFRKGSTIVLCGSESEPTGAKRMRGVEEVDMMSRVENRRDDGGSGSNFYRRGSASDDHPDRRQRRRD